MVMQPVMKPSDVEPFLAEARVAVLATIGSDGAPLLTPIWYEYRDGKFLMSTGRNTLKVRNIRRNPHASLCIDERSMPYKWVLVQGTATLSDDHGAEVSRRIFRRYLPERGADQYAGLLSRLEPPLGPPVTIILSPQNIVSWDMSRYFL